MGVRPAQRATGSRAWMVAGLITVAAVGVADIAVQQRAVLLGVLAAGLGTLSSGYPSADLTLAPHSLVLCYTDGLAERRDRSFDEGLDRLIAQIHEHSTDDLDALCDKLVADPFVPHPAPDDLCVLALRTDPR